MIIYCIVTAFLNVLGGVILGTSVLMRAPRRSENHLFAWFAASTVVWSFFYLLWQLAPDEETALLHARLLTGAAIFIPISYFHFASRLTGRNEAVEVRLGYLVAVGFAAFSFSPYLVKEVVPVMMFPYWPKPGPVFWPFIATFLYYTARSWLVLFSAFSQATHWRKKQLGYVCFGTVVGWLGGLTNFLLWVDIPIPPIGNGLALIYILAVGYAMMRFRLVDIHVFVIKGLVYLLFAAVISSLFPLTIFILRTYVPAGLIEFGNIFEYIAAFFVTLALIALMPRFTRAIDAFLEERTLGSSGDDRHRLREHIRSISTISGLDAIFEATVKVVSESLRGARVELFCRHDYEADFGWQAGEGAPADEQFFSKRLTEDDWLVRSTSSSGKALVVYEEEKTEESAAGIAECDQAGVELAIPIHADQVFYGVLLCGGRGDDRLYSDIDISLLEAVCIQIGLTIRARELERKSNRTEKLISLGTLAAGLAHELRNPLVSIRTFTGLIGEQGGDEEFRRQFSNVVERDVNRIGAIIDQVAAFASNPEANFSSVRLDQVIRDVRDISKTELEASGVRFTMEEASLPLVRGNYSQLIQVFLNLLQNSLQAFETSSSPAVGVSFVVKRREDGVGTVVVVFSDNGPGIPPGIRQRIFDPFVSTKNTGPREPERGMGLGLGIVKCIVEAHGGKIDLATTVGSGTTFYVELPCDAEDKSGMPARLQPPKEKSRSITNGEKTSMELGRG